MSETETVPESIIAQQIAEGVWGLEVNGTLLDDRFDNAKEAVTFGKEKYGIEAKAKMLPKKGATKKSGSKKKESPKNAKPVSPDEDDVPEELKKNHVAKTHVDGDIRFPRAIRDQLPLKPGERWKFSIVSVSAKEFAIKAVKVEG